MDVNLAFDKYHLSNVIVSFMPEKYITGCGVGTAFLWAVPVTQPSRLGQF